MKYRLPHVFICEQPSQSLDNSFISPPSDYFAGETGTLLNKPGLQVRGCAVKRQ
jgi:hypothetical protein